MFMIESRLPETVRQDQVRTVFVLFQSKNRPTDFQYDVQIDRNLFTVMIFEKLKINDLGRERILSGYLGLSPVGVPRTFRVK